MEDIYGKYVTEIIRPSLPNLALLEANLPYFTNSIVMLAYNTLSCLCTELEQFPDASTFTRF